MSPELKLFYIAFVILLLAAYQKGWLLDIAILLLQAIIAIGILGGGIGLLLLGWRQF